MHLIDWLVVVAYLLWIVIDGLRRTHGAKEVEGYFLAHRSLPWWAVGLSVMATQLSAITLVGTTGQGYTDGLRFVQFYYGLPIAMIILCDWRLLLSICWLAPTLLTINRVFQRKAGAMHQVAPLNRSESAPSMLSALPAIG